MRRPVPPLAAGLMLVLPALLAVAPPAAAATTKEVTISTATASPEVPFKAFDGSNMKLFDFDGDGDFEIIAHNDNRFVYVFDSKSGAILAELRTHYPAGWGARPLNGPEAAVLVQGGVPHVVIANSAAYVTSFRFDGVLGGDFRFTKLWQRQLNDCGGDMGMDSKVALSDLDKDGDFEILGQVEQVGLFALRHDGSIFWKRCLAGGNADASAGDLDGDGWPEAVFVSDGGRVTALNGRTGNTKWTFWTGGAMPVGATIAQLDGKDGADLVVGVRDKHDCTNFENNHASLFAISGWGHLLWKRNHSAGNPLTYTHPIVADVDNDGQKDVIWADWNTQGHKCGAWETTGPANVYRYDAAGNLRWRTELSTFWSNKDLVLADADGDGVQEVLANGPNGGQDGIWYLNSRTGAKETFVSTWPWKVTRGPVAEDLWGDGTLQWVVPVYAYGTGSSGGAVLVFDTHVPYNAMWPHVPYPTLGGGGGGDDPPPPPPPPPPGEEGFDATFRLAEDVNNWWVEVYVQGSEPVAKVEAQVDGGDWRALAKKSWGAWAASFFIPTGASVVFRAADGSGETATSSTYTWLSSGGDEPPPPPPPPPPPGNFTATFTLSENVNNWWVEVYVKASEPLAGVDARVNGGSWVALEKKSWGSWAKSFHVADGAKVEFQARSADGDAAMSGSYTWA